MDKSYAILILKTEYEGLKKHLKTYYTDCVIEAIETVIKNDDGTKKYIKRLKKIINNDIELKGDGKTGSRELFDKKRIFYLIDKAKEKGDK